MSQILTGFLVLPGEGTFLPHISPALLALGWSASLGRAPLKRVALAGSIVVMWRRNTQQVTQINEVRLGTGAFVGRDMAPFGDEVLSSTLSILRRKCERIHQALKEHSWDFYHIGFGR